MPPFDRTWSRRALLRVAPASLAAHAGAQGAMRATFGKPIPYQESHGDVWTPTWAGDGHLYVVSDDTRGFNNAAGSNLAIHRITGDMPPEIAGVTINPMREYGSLSERRKEDRGMWKASGLASVDGVLYLSVSRHGTPAERPYNIQQTWDASIVKSADHGKTWSPMAALGAAMFPGPTFSNPYFVHYGRDGRADRHGADIYVYAVSNDGTWNNGSSMILGRVRRDRLAHLDASDWEFIQGFDRQDQPMWGPRLQTARYIFRAPGRTSMTGMHFIPGPDVYVLPQWHYTHLEDPQRRWRATRFEFYAAPRPWGPWSLFHTADFEPEGFYNPSIPAKFISPGGTRFWLFCAGDFTGDQRYYRLHMIPVALDRTA